MRLRTFITTALLLFISTAAVYADRPLSEIGHPAVGTTFTDIVRVATILAAFASIILIIYLQFFR